MELTSSADESLPLSHPPFSALQFDVLFMSFPSYPSHSCLQANSGYFSSFCPEQFPAGNSSWMTDRSLAVTFTPWLLPHACSGPAFFVFARKGEKEHHQKTICLQNHPHMACSWLKTLGYWLLPAFLHGGSRQKARAVGGINGRILLF